MKKIVFIMLAALLLAALLLGCADAKQPAESLASKPAGQDTASAAEPAAPGQEGVFVTVNGVELCTGIPYAEYKEQLGEEIKPAEEVLACDPSSDWKQTMHFYQGVTVSEDKDGLVNSIQVEAGDAAILGKLGIGSTREEVKALLGQPDEEDEWNLFYSSTQPQIMFISSETDSERIASFNVIAETAQ